MSTSRYLLSVYLSIYYLLQTLVSLPMDEFNDMLSKNELSEDQLNVCRDIRRRGKNKVWSLDIDVDIDTLGIHPIPNSTNVPRLLPRTVASVRSSR